MKAGSQVSMFKVSEIKVSYHPKFKACDRPKVDSSIKVYNVLINNWNLDKIHMQEQFYILLLNNNCNVIGIAEISSGGVGSTLVDPKIVFSIALKTMASSIILAHNHPSENLQPSTADISLTKRLQQGAKLLDINVLDHLIITPSDYYSFNDQGIV